MKTFMTMVEEFCLSLVKHGVKRVFFVNSHVGNDPAIWYVANKFSIQGLMRVGQINLWALSTEVGQGISELKENTFKHAGEIMTSVVMAIRPDTGQHGGCSDGISEAPYRWLQGNSQQQDKGGRGLGQLLPRLAQK